MVRNDSVSSRNGWQGTINVGVATAPVHPNKQRPEISVHIRAYWPHTATAEEVMGAFLQAMSYAQTGIEQKLSEEGK